ncbi:DUF4271 domain-containing protein [Sphingobacterium deserti]|uniref:DUF4271 domain-containing protein n=1 Tax=Sphingobacterium deserti TaxID=1229276 RepID=A0A0B8T0I6_9SPHI|nr:DUF4271 domain-containing protein [Sphingobacterium deserti]KGE14102.1 hypothetical protein DI53_2119 [Sphingobacterium deserti]
MYWLKRILITGLFFLSVLPGICQSDSLQTTNSADSVMMQEIDTFNYIYPPDDRPHQLLQRLLAGIQTRSVDFEKSLSYMRGEDSEVPTAMGTQKISRPAWILGSVFVLFFAVGLVRILFPGDFTMIVQAYYNERTLQQISKEDNMLTSWPYILLYLIFSLALGLFIVLVESSFLHHDVLNWSNYLRTTVIVAVLFVLKILLIRFISFVFEIGRLVREYVTVLYLVYFNSMLFLMPILLAVTLIPANYFKFVLILFSVVASILFIYRFLRTALRLFGNLKFSIFYLILYLCALEVAPILILVKTLSN